MNRLQYYIAILCAGLVFGCLSVNPAISGSLVKQKDKVVLTVSGNIKITNNGDEAAFDNAMLEQIGVEILETTTVWTEGLQTFTGVSIREVLDALDVYTGTLKASAINDYAIELPVSDVRVEGGPIIAYRRNGEEMSIREKGPLWIVFPYDDNPDYQSELYYSRSIWQLDRIEVLP